MKIKSVIKINVFIFNNFKRQCPSILTRPSHYRVLFENGSLILILNGCLLHKGRGQSTLLVDLFVCVCVCSM